MSRLFMAQIIHIIHTASIFGRSQPTVGVSRLGWERGLAAETGKTQSRRKCLKTRRVPQVGCTRCWAHLLNLNIYISKTYATHPRIINTISSYRNKLMVEVQENRKYIQPPKCAVKARMRNQRVSRHQETVWLVPSQHMALQF